MTQRTDTLLQFPCDFLIKAFGNASDQFELEVLNIIRTHVAELKENAISCRPSKDNKYLAISITVHVESKAQIDNIYRDLSSNPHVLMAL